MRPDDSPGTGAALTRTFPAAIEAIEVIEVCVPKRERNRINAQYGTIPDLQKKLAAAEKALRDKPAGHRLLTEEVTDEDIAQVVAAWTHIPVSGWLNPSTFSRIASDRSYSRNDSE